MLWESVSSAACTRETPLPVVSTLFSAFKRACDAAEVLNPASVQGLPRPQRHGLCDRAVAFEDVARHGEERRKARRIDIRRFDVIRRTTRPPGGAVALRDGSLPGDLLIGMGEQIQRNAGLLTLILARVSGCTSGPTLATTASSLLENRLATSASLP